MSLKRRIERIEAAQLKNQHDSPSQNSDAADERKIDARRYMMRHLRLVAAGRRGELGPEEAAQVEAMNAAAERRFAKMRG
ncbi:MAG: hypothetical protein K0Q96_276 [Rubrobacteraceae bacterium]|jgi:hypothetical protein|nr:hypothetical protein [Rubrobacteraceae bacterium]